MDLTKRTEARRFITLIDTLYDAKVGHLLVAFVSALSDTCCLHLSTMPIIALPIITLFDSMCEAKMGFLLNACTLIDSTYDAEVDSL